jgi:ABC-type arginine transport system permease subunit
MHQYFQAVIISGAESKISFDSIQKLVFSTMGVALLSYCAVSPRSLPFPEYNRLFLQNLFTVGLGALPPLVMMLCVYDGKYNNINTVVSNLLADILFGKYLVCRD